MYKRSCLCFCFSSRSRTHNISLAFKEEAKSSDSVVICLDKVSRTSGLCPSNQCASSVHSRAENKKLVFKCCSVRMPIDRLFQKTLVTNLYSEYLSQNISHTEENIAHWQVCSCLEGPPVSRRHQQICLDWFQRKSLTTPKIFSELLTPMSEKLVQSRNSQVWSAWLMKESAGICSHQTLRACNQTCIHTLMWLLVWVRTPPKHVKSYHTAHCLRLSWWFGSHSRERKTNLFLAFFFPPLSLSLWQVAVALLCVPVLIVEQLSSPADQRTLQDVCATFSLTSLYRLVILQFCKEKFVAKFGVVGHFLIFLCLKF